MHGISRPAKVHTSEAVKEVEISAFWLTSCFHGHPLTGSQEGFMHTNSEFIKNYWSEYADCDLIIKQIKVQTWKNNWVYVKFVFVIVSYQHQWKL